MTTTPTDELATIFREALEQDPACTFAAPAGLRRIGQRHAHRGGDHAHGVGEEPSAAPVRIHHDGGGVRRLVELGLRVELVLDAGDPRV
jgi:hypothetical protein